MPKEVLYMYTWACIFNPLTPISDQEKISPYNIKQTSDENKEKYHLGDYQMIQY